MSDSKIQTALLIIDLQKEFATSTVGAIPNVLKLSKYFLDRGFLQIFIQDTEEGREIDTDGFKLLPAIADAHAATKSTAPLLVKTTRDAFASTDLEKILRDAGVGRVVVIGYASNQCCTATATTAKSMFETWFIEDAMAADSKEEHDDAVSAYAAAGGLVRTMQDVINQLDLE
jgi:nicotinamidase-related amidase